MNEKTVGDALAAVSRALMSGDIDLGTAMRAESAIISAAKDRGIHGILWTLPRVSMHGESPDDLRRWFKNVKLALLRISKHDEFRLLGSIISESEEVGA